MGVYVYIARCCAPFTLAHKREVSTSSCGRPRKQKIFEGRSTQSLWQLKKVERRQRKRVAPRSQQRRAARRKQPRRDNSDQYGSTATLHWRTQTSKVTTAFQKERRVLQVNLVVPFVFRATFLLINGRTCIKQTSGLAPSTVYLQND